MRVSSQLRDSQDRLVGVHGGPERGQLSSLQWASGPSTSVYLWSLGWRVGGHGTGLEGTGGDQVPLFLPLLSPILNTKPSSPVSPDCGCPEAGVLQPMGTQGQLFQAPSVRSQLRGPH